MRLRERVVEMRELITKTAAANGARDLRIFGSVARGDDHAASDIDVLVTLERGRTLFDLARLEVRLEALIGRPVDAVTESGLREPVRSTCVA